MAIKGMFDDELILPGVITEIINDYSVGYDTSEFGTTDAVTVIGTAFNGPVGIPVPIYSPEYAKYMYGEAFDSLKRREASLVPEIYDVWNKGCRTIYAVRLSGKDMHKDFDLAVESDYMLRISGQFPCNENKKCFMLYKAEQGGTSAGVIRIYKPADRTTVQEKLQGVVDNINSILVKEINLAANGLSKGSRLLELVDMVNGLENNNVLTLSIVDKQGNVVTEADKEVQKLNIGDMFPGIYTLCRDKVGEEVNPKTDIDVIQVGRGEGKPYQNFNESIWKKLVINTDVKKPYPIFAENQKDLQNAIPALSLDSNFDFLRKPGLIDAIAIMDEIDYEEVDLEPFEIYKRLGKGFVNNAKLEKVERNGRPHYKVVQPAEDDTYRVVGINDGIYSMLENHKSDYLVLAGVTAETKIENTLPRKEEFKVTTPAAIDLMDLQSGEVVLVANCKVDSKDFGAKVDYDISIKNPEEMGDVGMLFDHDMIDEGLSDQRFIRMAVIDKSEINKVIEGIEDDLLALAIMSAEEEGGAANSAGVLVRYNAKEKRFIEVEEDLLSINEKESPKLLVQIGPHLRVFKHDNLARYILDENPAEDGKQFIVATSGIAANIYFIPQGETSQEASLEYALRDIDGNVQYDSDGCILTYRLDANSIAPIISLRDFADGKLKEDDFTVVVAEADIPVLPFGPKEESHNETFIGIYSNEIPFCSQEEMVSMMNSNTLLKDRFEFEIAEANKALEELPNFINGSGKNKGDDTFDEFMYIPYSTTDNFARHLAQHCLYTQLKTYPTHGIIGCEKLSGVNLSTVAERVNQICDTEFDLFAKKDNGNYMFDSDNQPCPLGRCISITFFQYRVPIGTYNYLSNGAGGYAGMVSNLPAERSSTNQPIAIDSLSFELSNFQLGRLNNKGIVCAKTSTNNGIVIVDGITQAPKTSAYRRLATTKTINVVDKILKETIEPYIGLVDSLSTRNSLNTAIKSALNQLVDVIINGYKFKISTDANEGALGIIRIDYVIVPCNEIREVRNRVEITDSL